VGEDAKTCPDYIRLEKNGVQRKMELGDQVLRRSGEWGNRDMTTMVTRRGLNFNEMLTFF
jgi:hypothetical protein